MCTCFQDKLTVVSEEDYASTTGGVVGGAIAGCIIGKIVNKGCLKGGALGAVAGGVAGHFTGRGVFQQQYSVTLMHRQALHRIMFSGMHYEC